ncbi:MAG TPA: D-glycerate dehydrogenase [Candidatus Sulfomarinibacteraceae bacterium]|nr:D-glycerate dehydrogenase [Candidatus Sulfomarinibacteraceae bacterium]
MADIFITRKTFDDVLERLDQEGLSYEANQDDTPYSPEELAQAIRACGAPALMCLLTDTVDAALMDAAPQLKVIANVAVGYNNVDVDAATERGILVTNTPDVLTETTADLAFALLLAAARRLSEADPYTRAGKYEGWELFQPHLGLDVHGKTLGIVGMGRIGEATAHRGALGFGMRVLYHGGSPEPEVIEELGAQEASLETLLQESDFVSLHVPLTAETRHMIARRELEMMKPSAILVNTARGPVVNEADLVAALKEGLIAGAGLDVFEEEPALHSELPALQRHVVLAPHIGSATTETRLRMSLMAAENAIAVLKGQRPPNTVNTVVYDTQ